MSQSLNNTAVIESPDVSEVSNLRKAAVLLMSLDSKMPGLSQQVLSAMGKEKSKRLLSEVTVLGQVETDEIDQVVDEFFALAISQEVIIGGKNVTDRLLKDSFGIDDSDDYFSQKVGLFDFAIRLTDKELLDYLNTESEQVSALFLSLLPDERSAKLLSGFSVEKAGAISQMMLTLTVPSYKLLWKFHKYLELKLTGESSDLIQDSQQLFKVSRVLEMMVSDTRNTVMDLITKKDQDSATKIKQLIFSFEDMIFMSSKDVQTVCVEVDPLQKLALAMTGSSEKLKELLRDNVSERLRARLDETLMQVSEAAADDIQQAQSDIVQLCRRLEQEEKIESLKEVIVKKQETITPEPAAKKAPEPAPAVEKVPEPAPQPAAEDVIKEDSETADPDKGEFDL